MEINIWGTRGSTPVFGREFEKYGGHTTCISVRTSNQDIVIDAGTGILSFDRNNPDIVPVLLLSHLHFDHIQGLMFYSKMYSNPPIIYAPVFRTRPAAQLPQLFDGVFFPVRWAELPKCEINEFMPGESFYIGNILVETIPTNHPGGCVAYKINGKLVFSGDHEVPLQGMPEKCFCKNSQLLDFAENAKIAIVDSMFSENDHISHKNWGHSHFEQWIDAMNKSNVEKIVFSHYSPDYNDEFIDNIILKNQHIYANTKLVGAREGMFLSCEDI